MAAAQRRVAGELQFAARREDAQPVVGLRIGRRQHEGGLRQVGPARKLLHGGIAQAVALQHDGDRVAEIGVAVKTSTCWKSRSCMVSSGEGQVRGRSSTPRLAGRCAQRVEPALQMGQGRQVMRQRQAEPAVHLAAQRDIGHAEAVADHVAVVGQVPVQLLQQGHGGGDRLRDLRLAALRLRRADQLDEGFAAGAVECGLLPVHPLFGDKALRHRSPAAARHRETGGPGSAR